MDNLKCRELSDIIRTLFEPNSSCCERCSFENYKEGILKRNTFYLTCKQKLIQNYDLPYILSFIFDLSTEKERDENQYYNLINLKDQYKHLVKEDILINNISYKLAGTINLNSINHYAACIINNINTVKFLEINKSYYYDGKDGSNKLIEIILDDNESIIEHINNLKPLILCYLKLN